MRSFTEFLEENQNHQFQTGVVSLLMPVVEGKMSFDDFVEHVVVPTFASQPYAENEADILNLLQEGLFDRIKGMFGGRQASPQPDPARDAAASARYAQTQAANRRGAGYSSPNDMMAQKQAARHASITDPINKQLQQMISQQLIPVVQKISDSLKQSAFKTGNRQLHRAAELFNQKLTQTAQGMKFQVAGALSDDQKQGFNKDRMDSRYSPEQRAQLAQAKQARAQGLTDDGDSYRLAQTPEEKAAAANRPAGSGSGQAMSMQDMSPQQRARLQKRMQQRRAQMAGGANVVGGVGGGAQNVPGNAATA